MEGGKPDPWEPQRLGAGYREKQLRRIVAFELRADIVYAKAKLSQNRTAADRARVMQRLSISNDQNDRECAREMASQRTSPDEERKT